MDLALITFSRGIRPIQRARLLQAAELNCRLCGISAGELDQATGRKARLSVTLQGSASQPRTNDRVIVICSICSEGFGALTAEKPASIWLVSQIRRAGKDEQLAALKWLKRKFEER